MVGYQVSERINPVLKAEARKLIKENSPKLFIVSVLFVAIMTVTAEFRFRLPDTRGAYLQYMDRISGGAPHSVEMFFSFLAPIGIALALLSLLVSGVVRVGFMSYCLKTTRGHHGDSRDIFKGFRYPVKVLLIMIISAALVTAWSLLLIFPGVIAFYRYRQAYYILLDAPEKSALQCIRESKTMMRGHKADLFILDLSFIGWFVLSALLTLIMLLSLPFSIPIVSIWLSPYFGLSQAAFYNRLLRQFVV